ncbi:uncharacterized protein LOC112560429 isoform X2 [Pomacea canaliculata]|uniref:uncharacterized protein LOC112560429 isoform X2 n=1 Tax=Pomacea canaliculata TaxID=400727 RepID=UPI000D729253|nr:uncharacterized protein LOC112560429 isoform X2 [Pomacea canaliculata]
MPSNVEIKARVRDMEGLKKVAATLSGSDGELLQQEDTFFYCRNGRLKLRVRKGFPSQLISYDRPDETGPKFMLGRALGLQGTVKKDRWLYIVGQTRVHVDQVHGLGDFMELEVMLKDGQTAKEGLLIAKDLMEKLGVQENDLLDCAYMDLILQQDRK